MNKTGIEMEWKLKCQSNDLCTGWIWELNLNVI